MRCTRHICLLSFLQFPAIGLPAQVVPGGVGDQSGTSVLRLWVSSQSANVTANGVPVDTLFDMSGAGNHLYAPSAAARPVLYTNQVNGYPAILFDGIQQYLADPVADTSFHNDEATLVAVVHQSVHTSIVSVSAAAGTDEFLLYDHEAWHHSSSGNFIYRDHQCAAADTTSEYVIITGVFGQAVNDIGNYHFGVASTLPLQSAGTPQAYNQVDRAVYVGQRALRQPSEFLEGYLVEVAGYNRKLTAPERDSVVAYFSNKYQLLEHCTNTGLAEAEGDETWRCRPNPGPGRFVLEGPGGEVAVYDVLGRRVDERHVPPGRTAMTLPGAGDGIFFMTCTSHGRTRCLKLLVRR